MPFNGSGIYIAPSSSWNPAVATTQIMPGDWNALLADLTLALSTCLLKNGASTTTTVIPFAANISVGVVGSQQGTVAFSGATSGTTTLSGSAVAGATTLTLPAATDTLVGKATTDTLTNKTLTSPVIDGTGVPTNGLYLPATNTIGISTNSTNATVIDSSQRLLQRAAGGTAETYLSSNNPGIRAYGNGVSAGISALRYSSPGGGGAFLGLSGSRGSAPGTYTVVNASDGLGTIQFSGDDGTQMIAAASIACIVDGTPGTNDMPGRLTFSTTPDGASSPTPRLIITNSGAVSMGNTSTAFSLQIPYVVNSTHGLVVSGSASTNVSLAANLGTINFGSGIGAKYHALAASSLTLDDTDYSITVNNAGTCTLTLPAASSYTGRLLVIRTITANTVVSASSNVVPLAGGAAGTAILAATAGKWATLQSDGTNWQIVQSN